MKYHSVIPAIFLERPNRFIARCRLFDGSEVTVHVKNTGRCKELLLPGVTVYLEPSLNPGRKTPFSLIAVQKGERLINMDSQIPNVVAEEALRTKTLVLPGFEELTFLKREQKYGDSRFDLYFESGEHKGFMEVKGVTLERNGAAFFPDAPTERGLKHMRELSKAVTEGYSAFILFVIQMEDIAFFAPNDETHRAFGDTLRQVSSEGVTVLARECQVFPDELILTRPVTVCLEEDIIFQ